VETKLSTVFDLFIINSSLLDIVCRIKEIPDMTKQTNHFQTFVIPAILAFVVILAACASQPTATQASQPQAVVAPTKVSQAANTIPNTGASTAAAPGGSNSAAPVAGSVSFSKDIAPMFQNSCVNCHGGEKTSKALDLKTFASLMAGSQNGAVIVPGDATNSKLVQSVQSGKMPKRGAKLTPDQIKLLVDWVNAGAKNN
jgi:mono/diheme cytochrome c family protein